MKAAGHMASISSELDVSEKTCVICATLIFLIDSALCIFVVSVTREWNTQASVFLFVSIGSLASLCCVGFMLRSRRSSATALEDAEAHQALLTSSSGSLKSPSLPVPSWTRSSDEDRNHRKDRRSKSFFAVINFPRPVPVHDREIVKK
ncbi:unnamed protein product [Ixodes persulcatus]